MSGLVRKSVGVGLFAWIALLVTVASARADGEPQVRDHRTQSPQTTQPQVRDHRKPQGNTGPSTADPALVAALTKAANAAINGPEIKKLKVNGHEFTVKKAKISNYHETLVITGQISHHLTARPDDQVYYTINKRGDAVSLAKFDLQRGGVGSIVGYPGKVASKIFGAKMTTGLEEVCQATGQFMDGKWESSADLIVAAIGLKARAWSPGGTITPSGGTPVSRPTGGVVRDHRAQ